MLLNVTSMEMIEQEEIDYDNALKNMNERREAATVDSRAEDYWWFRLVRAATKGLTKYGDDQVILDNTNAAAKVFHKVTKQIQRFNLPLLPGYKIRLPRIIKRLNSGESIQEIWEVMKNDHNA